MAFLRKNALERAMQRAARDPDRHHEDFLAALLEAKLLVPEPALRMDEEGRTFHAVFSSAAALRRAFPDAPHEEVAARDALARFEGSAHRVVLDYRSDPYYVFDADEVRAVAQGLLPGEARLTPRTLPVGQQLALSLPEPNPVALKGALLRALGDLEDVRAAWLLQMADRERARLFLGIELVEGDDETMAHVVEALDPVLQDELAADQLLDVAMLNDTSLLAACREVAPPFFSRR
jgi:hypothetical protein